MAIAPSTGGNGHFTGEKGSGERIFRRSHLGRRPGSDNLSAVFPGSRADIHQIICRADHLQVVFDHQNGVAQVAQAAQDGDQTLGVALVQADGRLVEHVQHAGQTGAEQGGQAQALGLARRKGRRGALHAQVARADFEQAANAVVEIVEDGFGDQGFIRGEVRGQAVEPVAQVVERQVRQADDGATGNGHSAAFGTQARALAVGTGLGGEILLQLFEIGGVGGVLVVAAQQVGGDRPRSGPGRW